MKVRQCNFKGCGRPVADSRDQCGLHYSEPLEVHLRGTPFPQPVKPYVPPPPPTPEPYVPQTYICNLCTAVVMDLQTHFEWVHRDLV